jgi:hypothetical protein
MWIPKKTSFSTCKDNIDNIDKTPPPQRNSVNSVNIARRDKNSIHPHGPHTNEGSMWKWKPKKSFLDSKDTIDNIDKIPSSRSPEEENHISVNYVNTSENLRNREHRCNPEEAGALVITCSTCRHFDGRWWCTNPAGSWDRRRGQEATFEHTCMWFLAVAKPPNTSKIDALDFNRAPRQ